MLKTVNVSAPKMLSTLWVFFLPLLLNLTVNQALLSNITHVDTDPLAVLTQAAFRWPQNTLIYRFDPDNNNFTLFQKSEILRAMKIISDVSCIKFKERTDEKGYVNIRNQGARVDQCYSMYGFTGSPQDMYVADWCVKIIFKVVHEFYHALGFLHEHTRYDRDLYVDILWHQVPKERFSDYDKNPRISVFSPFEYEYLSIMHYPMQDRIAFTKTYTTTVKANELGQRVGLTKLDIQKLNSAYKCDTSGIK